MTSTYTDYLFYSRDMTRSIARVQQEPQVTKDSAYYQANIGKVKSVDDFLADSRLYNYAMQAYGLSDMAYAKAFMKKVLKSDLTDTKSFAMSLTDTRYQAFARAFHFATDGTVAASQKLAQTDDQEDDTVGLYTDRRTTKGNAAQAEAENYQSRIGLMTSVDDFLRDDRLVSVALTAFGMEPKYALKTTLRSVLTSDLSDPNSVANTLGDSRYVDLAKAFGFATDGSVPAGSSAQSSVAVTDTIYRYYDATGSGDTPAAAAFKTDAFKSATASIGSVDDLLNDDRLYNYALTAFGLNPNLESKAGVRLVLLSDLSDPQSAANQLPSQYQALAGAFNFNADGTVSSDGVQSADQLETTVDGYLDHYDDQGAASDTSLSNYYKSTIGNVTTVDGLLSDSRIYTYVLDAFGFDANSISKTEIRRILISDASDPKSYANSKSDPRYRALASAFNFASDGKVTAPLKPQSDASELATIQLYNRRIGTSDTEKAAAKIENTYFHDAMGKVTSVDEVLKDKRLVTYLLKTYDLDAKSVTNDTLKKVLTSDPFDKSSFAAKQGDERYLDLAAAFNFTGDGELARAPASEVQTRGDLLTTADLYLQQTLEVEAGNQNQGVRLALYFRRKAPDLTSAYSILADKALIETVRTALGLPDSFSQQDIDKQAKYISSKINIDDFKDPAKLEKFLAKFTALYDVKNSTASTTSPALLLLGGGDGSDTGFTQSLLQSIASLKSS